MKLLKLTLENFQGIKKFDLVADCKSVDVYGTNGAGKTTIANAISWLLYDKAYTGQKSFSPKTKGSDGEDLHYLDHSAEGIFALESGEIVTLKKVLSENWTKKRGSNTEELSGNVVNHFVDKVPVKKTIYDSRTDAICTAERSKILTAPDYFAEVMKWNERREILLQVCGDVTDEEVFAKHPDLLQLSGILKKDGSADLKYTIEEYLAIAKAKKAEINRELQSIPSRIDEANKAIPHTDGLDESTIKAAVQKTEDELAELSVKLLSISDTAQAELRKKLAEKQAEFAEERANYLDMCSKQSARVQAQQMTEHINSLELKIAALNMNLQTAEYALENLNEKREKTLNDYAEKRQEEFEETPFVFDDICPSCGQPIPEHLVDEAKKKHANRQQELLEKFNLQKSKKLSEINEFGKNHCSKDMILEKQVECDEIKATIQSVIADKQEKEKTLNALKSMLKENPPFEDTLKHKTISKEIAAIQASLEDTTNTIDDAKRSIMSEIEASKTVLEKLKTKLMSFEVAKVQNDRIEELKKTEENLAQQYETAEKGTYLCEQFIKAKVSMLTESINRKFETVRFRLFKNQINGGVTEDCEVLTVGKDGLVPYSTSNNAARINAGIEIIDTLSKHWGISMPIIVDNAESVVALKEVDAQVIRLVVSEVHQSLAVNQHDSLSIKA